jgi:hypothetical protein
VHRRGLRNLNVVYNLLWSQFSINVGHLRCTGIVDLSKIPYKFKITY